MKNTPTIFLLMLMAVTPLFGQKLKQQRLNFLAEKYTKASFDQLYELLSIPNDANFPEDIERNVQWCEQAFGKRGFQTNRIHTTGAPLLLAERPGRDDSKTVLIYLQIDGQPVDSSKWFQESPWKPALKQQDIRGRWEEIPWSNLEQYDDDWRVFARAASDAKGPVSMFLAALDALEEEGIRPNFYTKVIMDFEEELGSPNLPRAVRENKRRLAADMLIIFDGPRHLSNEPTLTFGARGIATITLTTYGPVVPQHSGHYGNYAPNPAFRLAQVLGTMKDDNGRVTIPGFYDGVDLDGPTYDILAAVPDNEDEMKERLGIKSTDKVADTYQQSIQYPSLNIRGMNSAWIGDKARTIVPATATAELDVRLVLETDPIRLINLIKDHIQNKGYYVIEDEPSHEERMLHDKIATFTHEVSYQSFRTDFDSEVGVWLSTAMEKAFGKEPIKIRMSGGSIPISPFVVELGVPAVTVPTVNRDNNQHSPNENLRLGNYREGIKTMIAIMAEKL